MLEFGQDIGIDLGTATVIAYIKGKGGSIKENLQLLLWKKIQEKYWLLEKKQEECLEERQEP